LSRADIRCEVLPNGLTLLTCASHLAPVAEIQVWANVGSADERPHEAGLAHFHEHMLFKGSERRGVGEIAGDVEGAGGRINAYTSLDVTVYHATLPSTQLGVGIDVLADAVLHSAFDPAEIDREIEVVLEEIRRSHDTPTHVLSEAVFGEVYRVHPYRAPILGTAESVAGFDRERVTDFWKRWYRPDNLTVVAVGDIQPEAVRAAVAAAFGDTVPGAAQHERPKEPVQSDLRSIVCARPFERANIELVYPTVGLSHDDCAHLDVLCFILGGCDSSRLVQRVKEREGVADRIDASCFTPRDPGLASIGIETSVDRAAAAVAATVREVERLRSEPVSREELERARTNFLAGEHFERESVTGIAYKLGGFEVTGGDHQQEERYLDAVRRVEPGDLHRVAREYLLPERLTVGAVVAEDDADGFDGDVITAAVKDAVAQNRRTFAVPAAIGATATGIHSYELPGGGRLHVIPRREVPVVAARAAFVGGLLCDEAESSGLTHFLVSMWLRGTRSHSTADFARSAENLAAEIDSFCGRSSFGVTLETPVEVLEPTLALFAEPLLEPAFDADELERERVDTLAAIERREDRLGQQVFQLFGETHFRSHPYRLPLLGETGTVAAFDCERVAAHHRRLVCAPNLSLAIAGDVDPDDIAVRVSMHLAGLPGGDFHAPAPPDEAPPSEIREAELHKDRAQAHLVIGFRGLSVRDEDRFDLDVISQLLAGQGGRLFLDLRDRRSLAYAVNAVNIEGIAPGYFAVYIATAPDKLDEARSGLLEILDGLLQAPPKAGEVERAVRHLVGSHAIGQQRNSFHAAHVSLDGLYGLGPDALHRYPERVEAVTPDSLLRTARRIIQLDRYTLAVVRP
jgi:zinc protease